MRLNAVILILSLQLGYITAFPPNPHDLSPLANQDLKGYECGNLFFTDSEVNKAVSLGLYNIDKGYHHPQRYRGKLYIESKFKEYYLWPIRKYLQPQPQTKDPRTVFRVVFTRDSNEAVDVIARLTNGDYTKCIRRDSPHIGPSRSEEEILDGYLCGNEFLTDETVHQSLVIAQSNSEGNNNYPSPYVGYIYTQNSGFLLWPYIKGKNLYKAGISKIGPYFLILNKERQFVDVVVKGYSNNYLRCIRSRKPPRAAPASDAYSRLFVPPPKSGFFCGKFFFDDKILEENAETVKSKVENAIGGRFPQEYTGDPFNRRCLVWPILEDGSLYKKGRIGNIRLILTPEYKVLSVAIFLKGKFKVCERKTIVGKKNHDTSGYLCNKEHFSHQQLLIAAKKACDKMITASKSFFPAKYEGPRFKLDGPYLTYPAYPKGELGQRSSGLHRVVINTSCEVVGALTTLRINNNGEIHYSFPKRLVKCHRLDDGPSLTGFSHPNFEIISEYKIIHN